MIPSNRSKQSYSTYSNLASARSPVRASGCNAATGLASVGRRPGTADDGDALPPTHDGSAAAVIHTAAAMVKHASLPSLLSITILPHLSVHIMMSA